MSFARLTNLSRRLTGRGLLLIVPLVLPAGAAAAQAITDQAVAREVDRFIRAGMPAWGIPGLSVVVVHGDSVVLLRGYGERRLGGGEAVDEHTLFGIMSTTKAMTALSLALLVDDRRLSWNDPVTRWVPEFEMPDAAVTRDLRVVDLLTHNAGLGNADLLWVREDLDAAEIFRRLRLLTPAYPLRGGFVYQNIMYGLAGEVIARASGLSFEEFLRRRIFNTLGMTETYPTYAAMLRSGSENVSAPHFRIRDTVRLIADASVDPIPAAGSVWSSARDMGTWVRFLLDSGAVAGRRVVSDEGFRMLFQPHALIGRDEFYPTARLTQPHWMTYGLGWFQQDYRGHFVAFHTGSMDGRTGIIGLLPDLDVGVYVFGNLDHAEFRHAVMLKVFDLFLGGPPRDWSRELLKLYGDLRTERDTALATADAARVPDTRPTLPPASYAGTYAHPIWGDVVVEVDGEELRMRMGSTTELRGPLRHWNYDTFRAELGDGRSAPGLVQFILDPSGSVAELRMPDVDKTGFLRVGGP
jgi:CubicO group peptidase (beta-lactamase class C family)